MLRIPPVVILEDIRVDNFSMIYHGVCYDDLQPVIERIALFHALSLVVHKRNVKVTDYTNNMIVEKTRDMLKTLLRGLQIIIEQTKTWGGFEDIHEKLKRNQSKILDNLFAVHKRDRGWGYNVLNHGDFHIRNMMFKRGSDGRVEEVKFLDFQLSHWGSPALDLAYLIHINGDIGVAERREEVYPKYILPIV